MNKYLNLVNYFGGKYPHLRWLLPLFPQGKYHFVDFMCGAATVALNVDYKLVTVNDLNDDIVNLFYVLREHFDEFMEKVYFTPYSRVEFNKICDGLENEEDPVERARQYYTKCQLGFGANGSQTNHKGIGFEYKITRSDFYRAENWTFKLKKLPLVVRKLRGFQIESMDTLKLFEKLKGKKDVIAYFDPPYEMKLRKDKKRYIHEVDEEFHRKLAVMAHSCKCKFAVSCFPSELYDEIYSGYYKSVGPMNKSNTKKKERRECLWTNYDPTLQQLKIFNSKISK